MNRFAAVLLALVLTSACASAPANLSSVGKQRFYAVRVVKALDALRDFAIDANAQVPPVLSTESTRKVVVYHESAIKIAAAVPDGWIAAIASTLDQLKSDMPPNQYQKIAPYVSLVRTLLAEVTK